MDLMFRHFVKSISPPRSDQRSMVVTWWIVAFLPSAKNFSDRTEENLTLNSSLNTQWI